MLYQIHEFQQAALTPLRVMNGAMRELYKSPFFLPSYTPFGRSMAAGCEVVDRVIRRYGKPDFDIPHTVIDGKDVAVTEEVVAQLPFCELLHFDRDTDREHPRVLLVAPYSGHHATLLRGTVESLLPDHDVYVTDWANARDIPASQGGFDLDDYIAYVISFMELLGPDVHVIAVCQPAVPVLAAISILAAEEAHFKPKSMVLMGGPVDTRQAPTPVNATICDRSPKWFEHTVVSRVPFQYAGAMRKVYPGFVILTGFMTMNMDRHVGAQFELFNHLVEGDGDGAEAHRRFYDEYLSVMDLPAEYYLQTLKTVFMDHALPKGTMTWRGRPVDPTAIRRTALMTVEGERDDITPPGQTRAAHDICPNIPAAKRADYEQAGVGHFGIFNGRRWREETYPRVRDFIRAHD